MSDPSRFSSAPFTPPQFDCAPGLRLGTHERVTEARREAMQRRLARLEAAQEQLERRLWLTVYGVAAVVLSQAVQGFLST